MSMLSSMCENLRIMARLVREYDYREISRCLRDAADTIDELRCRCQDANGENEKLMEELEALRAENGRLKRFAKLDENTIDVLHSCIEDLNEENAKLREELGQWHRLTAGIELPEYPIAEFRPKDLERENAKLKELVADMWRDGMCECDEFGACDRCDYGYLDRMRELGIEDE